MINDNSMING